ncbi:MAG: GNAT family N-acetyltransferase [Candidatus Thermoplasmatota archaeon]
MKIHEAEAKDIDAILELKRKSMGPVWREAGIDYDDESLRKFLQDRFVNDRMIVAQDEEAEERLVGFLHSTTFEGVVTSKKIREVLTLAVHPDHFGEGIGRELMENERKDAKSKNVDIVRLEVLSNNQRAIDFYGKQEFSEKKKILIKKLYSDDEN